MAFELALDELSVALLLILLVLLVIHVTALRPPQAQAHPILLGKQGDSTAVRNSGESAVWRSNQSMGRMVIMKPNPSVRGVADLLVEPSIRERARRLAAGLKKASEPGTVAVYTNDYEAAFALSSAVTLLDDYDLLLIPQGVSSSRVAKALSSVTAVLLSAQTLKEVESGLPGQAKVIVSEAADEKQTTLRQLEEQAAGSQVDLPSKEVEIHAHFARALLVDEVDGVGVLDITHGAITSAAYTFANLLPMVGRSKADDRVISFFDPSEPFGLGLAFSVAFTGAALSFANASFGAVDLIKASKAVLPTLIFAPSNVAAPLAEVLSELATSTAPIPWMGPRAYASKLARLRNGHIGPHAAWDPIVYRPLRQEAGLDSLRAVLLYSSPSVEGIHPVVLDRLRVALSCPVLTGHRLDVSTAPIFTTHPYDVQAQNGSIAHSGPPAANVAAKVIVDGGEATASAAGRVALTGELLLTSPSILQPVRSGPQSSLWQERSRAGVDDGESWFRSGQKVDLRPNGTFVILRSRA